MLVKVANGRPSPELGDALLGRQDNPRSRSKICQGTNSRLANPLHFRGNFNLHFAEVPFVANIFPPRRIGSVRVASALFSCIDDFSRAILARLSHNSCLDHRLFTPGGPNCERRGVEAGLAKKAIAHRFLCLGELTGPPSGPHTTVRKNSKTRKKLPAQTRRTIKRAC